MRKSILITTALLVLAVMALLGGCAKEEQAAEPNAASKLIPDLTSTVSADNVSDYDFTAQAMEYLGIIGSNYKNRDCTLAGEDNTHEYVREWIIHELTSAGYSEDQIEEQHFDIEGSDAKGTNVILSIQGRDSSKQIIAGAHYDGDGAGDNGSGTALLLAAAKELYGTSPNYNLTLVFYDAEEIGCYGSLHHVQSLSETEIDNTLYMINLDSLAFGDYCNVYGGTNVTDSPAMTEGYDFAATTAEGLGLDVWRPADLDGYYEEHSTGPEITDGTIYTNPWTQAHPAPANFEVASPATIPASDHMDYMDRGIEYIYFEATNWFAAGNDDSISYTGYFETYDESLGNGGMFMNTKYDTLENMEKYFPGRAEAHFHVYAPLLSALLLVK